MAKKDNKKYSPDDVQLMFDNMFKQLGLNNKGSSLSQPSADDGLFDALGGAKKKDKIPSKNKMDSAFFKLPEQGQSKEPSKDQSFLRKAFDPNFKEPKEKTQSLAGDMAPPVTEPIPPDSEPIAPVTEPIAPVTEPIPPVAEQKQMELPTAPQTQPSSFPDSPNYADPTAPSKLEMRPFEQSDEFEEFKSKKEKILNEQIAGLKDRGALIKNRLAQVEKYNNEQKELTANFIKNEAEKQAIAEDIIPKISEKIKGYESKREKLLNVLSSPVQRRKFLTEGTAFQAASKMVFSGIFDALGQIANVKAGTNHKTFFDFIDEEVEKQYEEDINERKNAYNIYEKLNGLIGEHKLGLNQYKQDYYQSVKNIFEIKEKQDGREGVASGLGMASNEINFKINELEEASNLNIYQVASQEVLNHETKEMGKIDIKQRNIQNEREYKSAKNNIDKQRFQDKLQRQKSITERNVSKANLLKEDRENIKAERKEKREIEKDNRKEEREAKKDERADKKEVRLEKEFKVKQTAKEKEELRKDKEFEFKKQQNQRDNEKSTRDKQSHGIKMLKELDEKDSGSKADYYHKTKSGETIAVNLTPAARKNAKTFERVSGGVTSAEVYKATRNDIKELQENLFSGNIVEYLRGKESKLKPKQTRLKALVRIMLTGGGNISDKEQVYLNDYVSGDVDMLTLMSKLGGGDYSTAVEKFTNYYREGLDSARKDIETFVIPSKSKNRILKDLEYRLKKENKK